MQQIVICTSVMQMLVASAILQLREGSEFASVVLFHPGLAKNSEQLKKLATQLGFGGFHDFTELSSRVQELLTPRNLHHKPEEEVASTVCEIDTIVTNMKQELGQGDIGRVYCRKARFLEAFFMLNVLQKSGYEEIEDGIGNYAPHHPREILKGWKYAVKFSLAARYLRFKGVPNKYLLYTLSRKTKSLNEHYLYRKNSTQSLQNSLRERIELIGNLEPKSVDPKIVVLGTLFREYRPDREIALYKHFLGSIAKDSQHASRRVIFRPHPRSPVAFERLERELGCEMDTRMDRPAEYLFVNQSTEHVYAFGSTSVIHAKMLFGLNASFVAEKNNLSEAKSLRFVESASKMFGIPIIYI